jgi:hypothetical protein
LGVSNAPSLIVTAEPEIGKTSEVLAAEAADSEGFEDSAKTIDVEVGSRRPREISSEFQRSFMPCTGGGSSTVFSIYVV